LTGIMTLAATYLLSFKLLYLNIFQFLLMILLIFLHLNLRYVVSEKWKIEFCKVKLKFTDRRLKPLRNRPLNVKQLLQKKTAQLHNCTTSAEKKRSRKATLSEKISPHFSSALLLVLLALLEHWFFVLFWRTFHLFR